MTHLPQADALCREPDPLDWTPHGRSLFIEACRELALFHYEHSSDLRYVYDRAGFSPEQIQHESDVERMPFFGVTGMKHFLLTSRPEEEAVLQLTSSGTSGQKTQIWLDQASLDRAQSMLEVLWQQEGLISDEPTNYLMFVYDPEQAQDLGIAFSCQNEQRFAPKKDEIFAIQKQPDGQWAFDKERLAQRVRAFADEGQPVRLVGIPSFLWEFLQWQQERGTIEMPPGSMVLTGGGWKAAEQKKVTPEQFRTALGSVFGIDPDNIRDGYGMAEHAAPYVHCREHRFHIPVFCRVIARESVTLEPLPPGEVGMLELVCPFNTMMPNIAILSTDLGAVDRDPCPCGRAAPTFTLSGRAGLRKHKGCAVTADELVRRV